MNAIIVSVVLGVIMMFSGILVRNKSAITVIATVALFLLLISNVLDTYGLLRFHIQTGDHFEFTKFGAYFTSLAIGAALIYVLLSGKAIENAGANLSDYYALIFFVLCGVSILSSFRGLLMLFLGIEIMTIPLYILTGADKRNLKSNEASLKYFLMGSFSTGIMLMGITLIYGGTGSFELGKQQVLATPALIAEPKNSFLLIAGLILIFVSICFKVSAAPFHFWTPDVYDGAPSVFTSFMATIVKAAGFVAFLRLFEGQVDPLGPTWKYLVYFVIIATLLVGNITAVFQQSVKRMLAYSSIAQAGFMLFAVYADNDIAKEGLLLYTVAYSLATIGIFAVLVKMKDYTFEGFNGLAAKQPVLALATTVCLLSLAGIPLTAGFFAKYYMLAAAIKSGMGIWLVIVAVLFAAVSAYYYFRVIQAMYFREGEPEIAETGQGFRWGMLALSALIILVGLFPSLVLNWFYF